MTTSPDTSAPQLAFAFEVEVAIDPAVRVGRGPHEVLHFVPITGGTVRGPRLSGVVLPGGGDWYIARDDAVELDAHYLLQADDGTVIDIVNRGFWRAPAEVEARLDAGEPVAPEEIYYRTSPVLRTDAPAHQWMCSTVFVGLASGDNSRVLIRFFEVL